MESKEMFFTHRVDNEIWNSSGIYFDDFMLFHHFGFSTGLRLTHDRFNYEGWIFYSSSNGNYFNDYANSSSYFVTRFVDIPIELNYTFNPDSKCRVSVHAGLLFEKSISDKVVLNSNNGKTMVSNQNNFLDWQGFDDFSIYDELGFEVSHRVFKKYVAAVGAYTYPRELVQTLSNTYVGSLLSPPILFNVKFGRCFSKQK